MRPIRILLLSLFLTMAAAGIWYWRGKSGTSQIESIAALS